MSYEDILNRMHEFIHSDIDDESKELVIMWYSIFTRNNWEFCSLILNELNKYKYDNNSFSISEQSKKIIINYGLKIYMWGGNESITANYYIIANFMCADKRFKIIRELWKDILWE